MDAQFTRRNALLNIFGEAVWGLKANLIVPSVILSVLLYQFGASPELIGSITAIETSMLLLPQMLGGYLFHSRARRKRQLVLWHYLVMLPFNIIMGLLTFFARQMDPAVYRVGMLLSFACYMGAIGVVSASWFEYFLGTIYESSIRGTVMGLSTFGASITGTFGALFASWLIGRLPLPDAYAWLYLISWFFGMISISLFIFIKDPGSVTAEVNERRPTLRSLSESLRMSLGVANFRTYLLGRVMAISGFSIIPFVAIYFTSISGGGLSKETVVASYSAFTIANAVGGLLFGRLGDRFGHRWGILLGASMQVLALLSALSVPGIAGCIMTYAGAGLAAACGFISHYNLVMEMCPAENPNRVAHISVANLVIGIPASLAPLAAGWVAGGWGIPILFTICLGISLAALLWLLLRFKEPRVR
jgi:MFS family permease